MGASSMKASEIRSKWIEFFASKGHKIEPSASLVPHNDPSLLWINAGMAPLKPYFDGREKPENPRLANSQKCIRTNDIENVGKTRRHHTFFEMLGNFSIGDYFKEETVTWAWEFLTSKEWIGFDPERLSVTVYPEDEEAFKLWNEKVGLPAERIIKLDENFWDIGEGPCGPCTEIFYDRGEAYGNDMSDPEMYPGGETNVTWKYGTWYSPSSTITRTAATHRFLTKTLIQVQVWSVLLPFCKMWIPTSTQTCSNR